MGTAADKIGSPDQHRSTDRQSTEKLKFTSEALKIAPMHRPLSSHRRVKIEVILFEQREHLTISYPHEAE